MKTRERSATRQCRDKFLDYFPAGFSDSTYLETERAYEWDAHKQWVARLGRDEFASALRRHEYSEISAQAVRVESRTNLLFSFEKMAVRDAIAEREGAREFASGLDRWLHGSGSERARFEQWCATAGRLPRRQTRVLTWPVVTVFGFIARPRVHMILKPNVTRRAAEAYGFPFAYSSTPQWDTYASLLEFTRVVRQDLAPMRPRDMIDVQSFLWIQGSDEYL